MIKNKKKGVSKIYKDQIDSIAERDDIWTRDYEVDSQVEEEELDAIDERSLVTDSDLSSMKNNTIGMQGTSLKLGAMA